MSRLAITMPWGLAVLIAGTGIASTGSSFRDRLPDRPTPADRTQTGAHSSAAVRMDSAWTAAPFRRGRTPAPERYTPQRAAEIHQTTLAILAAEISARDAEVEASRLEAERPQWTLKGTLLGSSRVAIFDGPTGPEATRGVIAFGEQVHGFTVSEVHADRVIVTRGEQAWTFTLASPWR